VEKQHSIEWIYTHTYIHLYTYFLFLNIMRDICVDVEKKNNKKNILTDMWQAAFKA